MELKKFTLVSNNICYGPCPEPDEEVEQRLTINAAGRLWFTGYNFGHGFGSYQIGRRVQLGIGKEKAQQILEWIGRYFEADFDLIMATDVGSWELSITDTAGQIHNYRASLCDDLVLDNTSISAAIRELIPIDDLFMFNGNYYEEDEE